MTEEAENKTFQSQINYSTAILTNAITGEEWDLLEKSALLGVVIYEDMLAPSMSGKIQIKDLEGKADEVLAAGKTLFEFDAYNPTKEDEMPWPIPTFYVYNVTEVRQDEDMLGSYYEVNLVTLDYIQQQTSTIHLDVPEEAEDDWMIPIHEYIEKLHYSHQTEQNNMSQAGYRLKLDETSNYVWYRPSYNDRSYESIRKDSHRSIGELIQQATEMSTDKENPNAVNFFYWQGMENWNFKSVEQLSKEEESSVYCYASAGSIGLDEECGGDPYSAIISLSGSNVLNELNLLDSGALFSTMTYSIPRINTEAYTDWLSSNIKTFHYRVNCVLKDSFPAALIGFQQIEEHKAKWRYAFAEVYLDFDYVNNIPSFRIKPIDRGGIRSWVAYKEDGPHWINGGQHGYDMFARAGFNTMESGNDGLYDYTHIKSLGWESPGIRLDTATWEKSCFKIQPIRGSMGSGSDGGYNFDHLIGPNEESNNVIEAIGLSGTIDDDVAVDEIYPVVNMKIYWDQDNEAHYFFNAANGVDGECSSTGESDCKDTPEDY
mgnify:CR=1 FL=1